MTFIKHLILYILPYKSKSLPFLLKIYSKFKPLKKELLFAFGGRSQYWKNMGMDLFKTEPSFKDSILKSDTIIKELGWNSILPNFNNESTEEYFDSEENILVTITAIQMAVFDCFTDKKIIPDAIIGLSLGEITGIYAAGALSRLDTLKMVVFKSNIVNSNTKKDYTPVFFNMDFKNLKELSKQYDGILPINEAQSNISMACIHKDEIDKLRDNLAQIDITFRSMDAKMFPYHTKIISHLKKPILESVENLEFRPLKHDYFSTYLGKVIPKGTVLSNRFCYDYLRYPNLTYTTFKAIKDTGRDFNIVQVGPDFFGAKNLQQMLTKVSFKSRLLSTLVENKNNNSLKKVADIFEKKQSKFKNSLNKNAPFEVFLENFSINNPFYVESPNPFWDYFKQKGNVHFLSNNQSCLVLGYEEIKSILNDTTCYSSEPFSSFDKYLAGSDPPLHTEMRSLLQPIFSKKALLRIELFTHEKIKELVNNFPITDEFNFVDYFSLPLSQTVITHFLGLNDEQSEIVKNIVGKKIYEVEKEELKDAFSYFLSNNEIFNEDGVMHFIKTLLNENKISLDAASSLSRLFWGAGFTTTNGLLSSAFLRLSNTPSLAGQLKDSDVLVNKFIEECLRLEPPQSVLSRIATQPVEISGKKLPAGSLIYLDLRAGNQDEKKFANPKNIDLSRPSNSNLAFGSGAHVCMGMALAKIEARIAIKAYLTILNKITVINDSALIYYPSFPFIALQELKVKLNNNII